MSLPRLLVTAVLAAAAAAAQETRETDSRPASRPASRLSDPLQALALRIAEAIDSGAPPESAAVDYDATFLARFAWPRVASTYAEFRRRYGAVSRVDELTRHGPTSGLYRVVFEEKTVLRMELEAGGEPLRVTALSFSDPLPLHDTRAKAIWAFDFLNGQSAVALYELGDGAPRLLDELDGETPIALAGVSKLFILGAVVERIVAGTLAWDDAVPACAPTASRPADSRPTATVRALVAAVLEHDDDVAGEALFRLVGRDAVEAAVVAMGVARPERLKPFFSPREAAVLKGDPNGRLARAFLVGDLEARRAVLEEAAAVDPSTLPTPKGPTLVAEVGWFATLRDVAYAWDWIRRKTASGPAAELRERLGANRGIPLSPEAFPYAAFKGGGERGVSCATWLFMRPDGKWYAAGAAWTNPAEDLDDRRFLGLVHRYFEQLAATL
ncbi:MAG TPA: serine hydrolase [Planctomycetota bacterium]|nr:serine hydrolase [Planctomycetota bacterium]